LEAQKRLFTLPDCAKEFESVFAKKDFNILPEHRQWDHAIELVLGSEPKSSKVYPVSSGTKGVGFLSREKPAHQMNPPFQISHGSSSVFHQEEGWLTLIGSELLCTQFHDG